MAAQTDKIKLFSQLGIDTRSEEQILHDQTAARQAAAMEAAQPTVGYAGESDIRAAGAYLGGYLANKFSDPEAQLTPDQKRDLAMREHAQAAVQKRMVSDPTFAAQARSNPQLAAIETQREMANWAFDNGHIELAAQLQTAAGEAYLANRNQMAEIARLEGAEEREKDKASREKEEHEKDVNESMGIITPNSQGYYDFDNLDQVTRGRWDPEKKAWVTPEGNEIDNFLTVEEAVAIKEARDAALEKANVDNVGDLTLKDRYALWSKAIPASERTGMRMAFDAMDTQSAIMDRTADLFMEFIEKGKDPAEFLDTQGKITAFATDIAHTGKALVDTWAVPIAQGSDEDVYLGKGEVTAYGTKGEKFEAAYAEELAAIEIPNWIKEADETGHAAAEYQSAIVQLAYAVARSNEPGARQLSDTDFRNALKELGAASSDPERLRRVVFQNFYRKSKQLSKTIQRTGEIAQSVGLDPEWARTNIYGSKIRTESLAGQAATLERYQSLKDTLGVYDKQNELDEAGIGRITEEQKTQLAAPEAIEEIEVQEKVPGAEDVDPWAGWSIG